jgi:hypothetical protein
MDPSDGASLPQSRRRAMPQSGWSAKRERQYAHIKEGLEDQGRPEDVAEEIAARTVNKTRARSGETKTASRASLKDISSARRWASLASRSRRTNSSPALRGSAASEHRWAFVDEQARTRAGARAAIDTG